MGAIRRMMEHLKKCLRKNPVVLICCIIYPVALIILIYLAVIGVNVYAVLGFVIAVGVFSCLQIPCCGNQENTALPVPRRLFVNNSSETKPGENKANNGSGKKKKPSYPNFTVDVAELNLLKSSNTSPKPDAGTCSIMISENNNQSSDDDHFSDDDQLSESKASITLFESSLANLSLTCLDQDMQSQMQEIAYMDTNNNFESSELEDYSKNGTENIVERCEIRGI